VLLSRWLDWRSMLTVVQPDTLIRWHRQGRRLFWRWKSRLNGKAGHVRTVPIPEWVKIAVDARTSPAAIREGRLPRGQQGG
jgi:hypothetical protein